MSNLKSQYLEILKGCGLQKIYMSDYCDDTNLCEGCQAKAQTFIQRCKDELEFLEKNYANFTWEGYKGAINSLQRRIAELQEVIEMGEENV